jgi:hypothetical protein
VLGLALDAGEQAPNGAELLHPVALERADLVLDTDQGVLERSQQGGGLEVLSERGLQVEHPLSQQIALGDHGGRARGIHQASHDDRHGDADDQPEQAPHPCVHGADSGTRH